MLKEAINKVSEIINRRISLTLFGMGDFGAGHGWGEIPPSLKYVTHILQW